MMVDRSSEGRVRRGVGTRDLGGPIGSIARLWLVEDLCVFETEYSSMLVACTSREYIRWNKLKRFES